MLARQGASVANGDLPESSLARVKEEVKVAVGGVEWEGSRVTFAEVKEEEDVKPVIEDIKPTLSIKPDLTSLDEKAARRLAKEERKRQKAASQPDIKPVLPTQVSEEGLSKEEKRKLKEEKRLRKEAKRASKSEKGDGKRKREGDEVDTGKKSKKDKS